MKVTITATLDDTLWGFSQLLRDLSDRSDEEKQAAVIDLLHEDIQEVLSNAQWEVELDTGRNKST